MASNTSSADDMPTEPAVIDMAEMGARVAKRKADLGLSDLPRNAGENRTASKRALLAAIERAGGKW